MTDPAREAAEEIWEAEWTDSDPPEKFANAATPIIRQAIEAEREACAEILDESRRLAQAARLKELEGIYHRHAVRIRQRSDSGEAPSTQNPDATRSCAGALPPSELDAQERMRRAIVQRFKDWHDKENVIPVIMGVRNDAGKVGYSYTEIHGDKEYKA